MERIIKEMEENKNNGFIQFIGEYLKMQQGFECPEGKSLKTFASLQENEMKTIARKNGSGNQCAGLSDAEFFKRADDYFRIVSNKKGVEVGNASDRSNIIDIMDLI